MKKKRVVGDQVREESENGSDMDEEDCMDEVQVADEEEDMEGQVIDPQIIERIRSRLTITSALGLCHAADGGEGDDCMVSDLLDIDLIYFT